MSEAMATPPAGPLAGLKVVELGQLIAGPFATKTLADFGAEVIKIEPPGTGDPLRQWRLLHDGTSVWWQVQSRNKQSVTLDLRLADDRAVVRRLIDEADVLVENFKPGTMEGWGLSYEALSVTNPGLLMLRISGYGQTGPYRDRPGFGVVAEAMGGLRHLTAEPGRVPVRVGVSIGDTLAALHGVIGVLIALHHRSQTVSAEAPKGRGQVIDVALYESVFNCMESLLPEYSAFGVVREPAGSALPGIAPSNAYACRRRPRAGRRQRRLDLQAADDGDRPRRPGAGPAARRQHRPRRARRRDRRRDRRLDREPQRRRGAGRAHRGAGAGRAHLHREGHRRRPALPRPRHDRAHHDRRRSGARRAGRRAQAEPHAGRASRAAAPTLGEHTQAVLAALAVPSATPQGPAAAAANPTPPDR